jgi:purine-binding chemotaxis protein CheW
MDIAKIRKMAHAKDAEKKPVEKPETGLPEEQTAEVVKEKAAVEESKVPVEESPSGPIWEKADDHTGLNADEGITDEHAEEMVELLTFSLSNEEYAFRFPEVEEILRLQNITRVPTMPDYVLGITSLRGKIIPVIDLKTRLNLKRESSGPNPDISGEGLETGRTQRMEKKILIIDGPKGLIGAMIDKVVGVVRLPRSEMLHPPGNLDENELKFIEAIVILKKRFISIIHSASVMDIEAT